MLLKTSGLGPFLSGFLLLAGCGGSGGLGDAGDAGASSAGIGGFGNGGFGNGGFGNGGIGGRGAGGLGGQAGHGGSAASHADAGDAYVPDDAGVTPQGLCRIELTCEGEIQDEPKLDCGLMIHDSAGGNVFAARAGIERRGRSSQAYDKPNYSLELRDAAGGELATNLLGMGGEADWILDGSWVDRSFMRNELAFAMFRATGAGRWAPEGRYCELSLNMAPRGIYRLGERIKRDDDRIDIPEDAGDGQSFVVKQDSEGVLHWNVGEEGSWALVSPDQERATEAQRAAAQAFLDQLDAAMQSRDEQAIFALLDLDALVDFVIVQELAKSADAYNLSLHLWKAPGMPAQLVPWDFDLSMGQPDSEIRPGTHLSSGWVTHRTLLSDSIERQPMFQERLAARFRMHRSAGLTDEAIMAVIDRALQVLEPSALEENFMIWPLEDVDFTRIYPPYSLYEVSSYEDEIEHLRGWLMERTAWMDDNIASYPD